MASSLIVCSKEGFKSGERRTIRGAEIWYKTTSDPRKWTGANGDGRHANIRGVGRNINRKKSDETKVADRRARGDVRKCEDRQTKERSEKESGKWKVTKRGSGNRTAMHRDDQKREGEHEGHELFNRPPRERRRERSSRRWLRPLQSGLQWRTKPLERRSDGVSVEVRDRWRWSQPSSAGRDRFLHHLPSRSQRVGA